MEALYSIGSVVLYVILALVGLGVALVLFISGLLILPDMLPQTIGGLVIFLGLGAMLLSPAAPVAVVLLVVVLCWGALRRWRKRKPPTGQG